MYLKVYSELYGAELYGPYDTRSEAQAAEHRIRKEAEKLGDDPDMREYTILTNAQARRLRVESERDYNN
jgi:hypothetical protein